MGEKAEVEELRWRQQRDQHKTEVIEARSALKPARAAHKEAVAEKHAMMTKFNRVEKAQLRVETAKTVALEKLQSETYDATQVEKAYDLKKHGSQASMNEQIADTDAQSPVAEKVAYTTPSHR